MQVDVKKPLLSAGLQELVDGEMLEGENAYQLDNGDKVNARKRICIAEPPNTLIIQLKRFQIDYETLSNRKAPTRTPTLALNPRPKPSP